MERRPVAGAMATLTCLWEEGVLFGVKATSGEHMSGRQKGVVKTRPIARRPAEER